MFKRLRELGPGVMVAAAFIGPGTVTTATIAGAGYGFTLLWAVLFSAIATLILQEMSARLGVISRMGVGEALRVKSKGKIVRAIVFILVISAILIGNAAYEAGNMTGAVLGFSTWTSDFSINPLLLLIAGIAFVLLFRGQYKLIESSLIALVSIMGVIFVVSMLLLQPPIIEILKGLFIPVIPENASLMVVGLVGTTVVPYNLFLHASSVKEKWKDQEGLASSRWDAVVSILMGGLITMAILICSSMAFLNNPTTVSSMNDLSTQLEPILGSWSSGFMAFGFLAAGLSSTITAPLAAAYATSEILGWKFNLKGLRFRLTWAFVLLMGIIFSSLGIKPTSLILFAQIANGLLLPVIAGFLVWILNDSKIMGNYTNSKLSNFLGLLVIIITILLGTKGVISALGIL